MEIAGAAALLATMAGKFGRTPDREIDRPAEHGQAAIQTVADPSSAGVAATVYTYDRPCPPECGHATMRFRRDHCRLRGCVTFAASITDSRLAPRSGNVAGTLRRAVAAARQTSQSNRLQRANRTFS